MDTPTVMRHLKELISRCNVYTTETTSPNTQLLENVGFYITKMLQIFGVIPAASGLGYPVEAKESDVESAVVPFASLVADFREEVRQISLLEKSKLK